MLVIEWVLVVVLAGGAAMEVSPFDSRGECLAGAQRTEDLLRLEGQPPLAMRCLAKPRLVKPRPPVVSRRDIW